MTDAVWIGMLAFVIAMIAGFAAAFYIEMRKSKPSASEGEGGKKVQNIVSSKPRCKDKFLQSQNKP